MFSRKAPKPQNRIDSLIGAGTSIEGDISFTGGLRIDGQVKGNVRAVGDQASTLVVSEHARIEGEVSVSHVVINGTVIGPVSSGEFLELQPKARVTGDVEYSSIEMHLGAVVQGRLVHQGAPAKAVELKLATSNN
jgi:cytoskeletal protein CcmA (bactofilin family)